MKAYCLDLRQKIVETYDRGGISQRELADRFCVSLFFVKKLFRQRRLKNTVKPLSRQGWQKSLVTAQVEEYLISLFDEQTDLTLSEIAHQLENKFSVTFSNPTICRTVKRLNPRHKSKAKRLKNAA